VAVSFMSRRNFTRVERINAPLLTGADAPLPAAA
jgi:hypothetical protein